MIEELAQRLHDVITIKVTPHSNAYEIDMYRRNDEGEPDGESTLALRFFEDGHLGDGYKEVPEESYDATPENIMKVISDLMAEKQFPLTPV